MTRTESKDNYSGREIQSDGDERKTNYLHFRMSREEENRIKSCIKCKTLENISKGDLTLYGKSELIKDSINDLYNTMIKNNGKIKR